MLALGGDAEDVDCLIVVDVPTGLRAVRDDRGGGLVSWAVESRRGYERLKALVRRASICRGFVGHAPRNSTAVGKASRTAARNTSSVVVAFLGPSASSRKSSGSPTALASP